MPVAAKKDAVQEELDRLRAENEALKAREAGGSTLSLKVSEKGAVSLYGIGRFPATFYRETWERILGHGDAIREFIAANDGKLKKKGE